MTPVLSTIDVVVPTYREARNIPLLIERLANVKGPYTPHLHLTIVEDDSRDGTEEAVVMDALQQRISLTHVRSLPSALFPAR